MLGNHRNLLSTKLNEEITEYQDMHSTSIFETYVV